MPAKGICRYLSAASDIRCVIAMTYRLRSGCVSNVSVSDPDREAVSLYLTFFLYLEGRPYQIIGRRLVHVVIQPVGIEVVCRRPPGEERPVCRIVVRIVVFRQVDGKSLTQIPFILPVQRYPVVFRMAHHKDLPSVLRHGEKQSHLVGFRQDRDPAVRSQLFNGHIRVAGMGRVENVVEAPHQRNFPV